LPLLKNSTNVFKLILRIPKFGHAFTRLASMDHHIATQAAYWIDAMGGGRVYHEGNYRLEFHHGHNVREVMNAAGAKRWM